MAQSMGSRPVLVFSVCKVLWYMATLGVLRLTPGFLMCSSSQLTVEEIEDTGDMENKEVAEETDGKGKSNSVALQINSNL